MPQLPMSAVISLDFPQVPQSTATINPTPVSSLSESALSLHQPQVLDLRQATLPVGVVSWIGKAFLRLGAAWEHANQLKPTL